MIEDELGVMAKRIAVMAEDRYSDHAVGKAVLELAELAMHAVLEAQIGGLSPAKRMDLESGIVDGVEWSPDPSDHLWQAADRYGRR